MGCDSTRGRFSPSLRVLLAAADRSLREHLRALFRDDDRFMVVDGGGDAVRQVIQSQPSVLVVDVSGRSGPVGESASRLGSSELSGVLTRVGAEAAPPGTLELNALLTHREAQIVSAVVAASSNKDIAAQFGITETTVKHHLSNIFDKVGVSSRLELAVFAQHHGLGQTESAVRRRRTRRSTRHRGATLNAAFPPAVI